MASLKSMMAAKRAQHRITAPHAKYSSSGQLSCSLCGLAIKHESLWGAHVQSKAHRVHVQRVEAEQAKAAERASAKRRREDQDEDGDGDGLGEDGAKRAREDNTDSTDAAALPDEFFADPSEAPTAPSPSVSTSTAALAAVEEASTSASAAAAAGGTADDDPEWAEFEKYLASGPSNESGPSRSTATATIKAAPVKFEFGAPVVEEEGGQGNANGGATGGGGGGADEDEEEEETEEAKLEREMREEREEMMARLEEEEREQREADEKVSVLKRRLEAIRAARQKKKAP